MSEYDLIRLTKKIIVKDGEYAVTSMAILSQSDAQYLGYNIIDGTEKGKNI